MISNFKIQYFKKHFLLLIIFFTTLIKINVCEKVRICIPYSDGVTNTLINACTDAFSLINTNDVDFECIAGGSSTTVKLQLINKYI